jgi:hypothetical protein
MEQFHASRLRLGRVPRCITFRCHRPPIIGACRERFVRARNASKTQPRFRAVRFAGDVVDFDARPTGVTPPPRRPTNRLPGNCDVPSPHLRVHIAAQRELARALLHAANAASGASAVVAAAAAAAETDAALAGLIPCVCQPIIADDVRFDDCSVFFDADDGAAKERQPR